MSFIRPELSDLFYRWREVVLAIAICALGLALLSLGGVFFVVLGLIVAAGGLALVVVGRRRMRFERDALAPGVVRVTEAQITYLAPAHGGFVALSELSRVRHVFDAGGRQFWILSQRGTADLAIPVNAAGSEALFDAFVALPGADPRRILTALDRAPQDGPITVWRPPIHVALT